MTIANQVFFTVFGEYSKISTLNLAATKKIIALAFPNFNVDCGFLLEKIFSTAMDSGEYSENNSETPS